MIEGKVIREKGKQGKGTTNEPNDVTKRFDSKIFKCDSMTIK
jgi:hypothetical protein